MRRHVPFCDGWVTEDRASDNHAQVRTCSEVLCSFACIDCYIHHKCALSDVPNGGRTGDKPRTSLGRRQKLHAINYRGCSPCRWTCPFWPPNRALA